MALPRPLPPLAVLGLLGLVAAIPWWPALDCGFVWDDDDYATQNPVLRSWGGLWQLWTEPTSRSQYYPLVHTILATELRLRPSPRWDGRGMAVRFLRCEPSATGSCTRFSSGS